jgi:hypothetical protein
MEGRFFDEFGLYETVRDTMELRPTERRKFQTFPFRKPMIKGRGGIE